MTEQAQFWSRAAQTYEQDFVDPYRSEVRSPLRQALLDAANRTRRVAADLGCGIGPLLPFLAKHFRQVFAVDFAEGMLDRARTACRRLSNVEFLRAPLTDLQPLA